MLGAPLGWVAIARPCGDLIHFMTDRYLDGSIQESFWGNLFTSFFIVLALTLGLRISFDRLEKQQLVIGTAIGTLLVRPDIWKTIVGTVSIGNLPPFPSWAPPDAVKHPMLTMVTTFGYVGDSANGLYSLRQLGGAARLGG